MVAHSKPVKEQDNARGTAILFDPGRGCLLPSDIIQKEPGTFLTVKNQLSGKMYSLGDQSPVQYQKRVEEDGVADMTQLEDLHDGAVLYNLKKRFEQHIIYTYIGTILLSVNPYKMYNIYGTDTVMKYKGKSFAENPPHLFAIANVAYSKMVDAKHNQCIIISGESGSGKTEATKLVLCYLASVHHTRKDNVTQQILEATPLLESFGNAKTVRNDNSSRFGKYIEIFLQDGVICGAITSQYLLEKSRIVFQAKNERNYHIFYEMLAGLSSQQKQRFYLQEAETYYYLNQGGNCEISGKDDGEDFHRLLSSMEVLSFSPDEQNSIFRILSSVLHLGNVYFEKYETDSQEIASVVSAREIRVVAELLQISPEGLQRSITYKVTETVREKIFTPLTVESAVDARDAVAKILYSLLFSWLTDRINKLVSPKTESLSIAILDIYGFEDLCVNSFEQLCINYANEYLQYFFNKIIFKLEQEEYIREQIDWKEVTFSDNQTCLDLISQKPHGILRILDDQSTFPQATDHTFLQKCHYHHGKNPLYSKPKMPLPEFSIKHYAGKVTYQVYKFIEKNHDQVRQDVMELFVNSKTKILTSLFSGQTMKVMSTRNNTINHRYQPPTVAAKFQQSLMELAEKMESCNPFFVRCIKPNNKKESELFEVDVVSLQLRYSGVLETIRIRKEGYPVRITFDNFIKRYKILLGLTHQIKADGENCITILKQIVSVSKGMYSIGLTKTNAANKDPTQPLIPHDAAKGKLPVNRPNTAETPKPKLATQDPVHHTTLNSEHFPEPTHNIKDIIRQYEQSATQKKTGLIRKEGGKIFTKKMDPHEEAMFILKGQIMPHVSQKPAPAPSKDKNSKEAVAMVKPVSGMTRKSSTRPVPAVSARHPVFSGASVSRELTGEDERIQTQLHGQPSEGYYTYSKMPCDLCIRKEVFYPKESFHSPVILDLIFRQIVSDTFSETCVRLNKEEQMKMKSLLAENKIVSSTLVKDEAVKRKIVMAAREAWDVYFCRLFPASGSVGTGVQILGVSHKGICLLKLVRASSTAAENLRVLRSYSYSDILFATIPSKNMLDFNLTNEKLILFSSKAPQVKSMIDYFITELKKDSNYVIAVKSHITNNISYLRFHKGDIIRLQPMDGLKEGQYHCYGCIVRKKVIYLEDLKKYTPDFGWKFGAFHGRSGLFPVEYVQPVAAPDFIHLSTDKKEEPMDKKGKVAASASATVAAAVGSTAAAEELDRKSEASPPVNELMESIPEYVLQDNQYTMIEFAKKYFRQPHKLKSEITKEKSKKGRDPKDPAEMVKYTKTPIQESLIEFCDENLNKVAAEIFIAVMKFMGDHPLKGQTEQDIVYSILKLCGEHEVMKDETYCQIIKQITDNTSTKTDSVQRGWRLLYILTAYYKCSEVFKPYLFKLLESVCRIPGASFQGIAKACDHNLKKTFQFGGRTQFPDGMELKAMVAGRSSKRQMFLLPGNMERHLKIKTCTVAVDVIEEFCNEMGFQNPEAANEYSMFVITNKGQIVHPLKKKDYILDVITEMEQVDQNFTFCFRRVLWFQPLKFENELCVTVHYNQIVPDYLKGLFHVLNQDTMSESQLQQASKLAALQQRAKDSLYLPTIREVQDCIPPQIYQFQRPQSWLNMVTQNIQHVQALSSHQARAQLLGLVSAFPMFGSSFFYIQSSSNSAIVAPCILAVNQNGLNFLNKETHELMVNFPLKEVQSTLTQQSGPSNSYPYAEIKLGDLMSQRITQLQLDQV
ncbi:unconventional myosin-XV [Rhincodon typus]|uniref:unconventional myosin-XV n=1 Tax=Rhincodon typus TaxID=259920 RepID=UPI002030431F|nr:unconventional myosin-XV [Rhincodon typus]